ncbi:MAG: hypothetical protein JWN56_196 [Sphingobacteriales bacterium]|nr:hypothetical protein [Sphingobacteriales bacterium]
MKYLFIILFTLIANDVFSQDIYARVQISAPQLQNTNQRTLEALSLSITDFLNTRQWSNNKLQVSERIECNFIITITEWDGSSSFKAEAQIQSSRPVFGTSYNSTVLNINDKDFDFIYSEGQAVEFSDQNYINNLSSLLGFYAYVIVGMDYDTFSKFGGTAYYNKAQVVLNNTQSSPNKGWKAFENLKNRYWLIENLQNRAYNPIRETLYTFHRQGLDVMSENLTKGRKTIISTLSQLQKIDKQKQGSILNQLFFTAKSDEFVNILLSADPQDKVKAYNILSEIDPANTSKYESLKKLK